MSKFLRRGRFIAPSADYECSQTRSIVNCHPERSEGSRSPACEILRCAQDDRTGFGREPSLLASPWSLTAIQQADKSAVGAINRPLRWASLIFLIFILTSCFGGPAQSQPDPRLKVFHILSGRIIMQDNQAEVDGTIQNSGHDPFPYDVTISATFYDGSGNVIGQAQGVAEDVFPGTVGAFVLIGQVNSLRYSHMQLTLVSLRERRVEHLTPTPPVSP